MNPLESLEDLVLPSWLAPLIIAVALAVLTTLIFNKGVDHERAKWVNKENAELITRQQKILELTTANYLLERKAVADANHLKAFYEGKLQDEKTHANAVIADVRAGAKRLSIATKQTVPACNGGISLDATDRSAAGEETRTELSGSAAEFLIAFASEADEAVIEGNYAKDKLAQCYEHVDALRAQSLNQTPSSLEATSLQLNSQPKENTQ